MQLTATMGNLFGSLSHILPDDVGNNTEFTIGERFYEYLVTKTRFKSNLMF